MPIPIPSSTIPSSTIPIPIPSPHPPGAWWHLPPHALYNKYDDKPHPIFNLAAGGISGAVSKTITAPLENVKLAIQNQDSNPRILSGEMKRYTGMGNCFTRHITELGATSLWRGNVANCVRYVPIAALNLMFKDSFKNLFPQVDKNKNFPKFAAVQIASGALAGFYTTFFLWLRRPVYNWGIAQSTIRVVVYRGVQFGLQDIIKAFNPHQKDFTVIGVVSKFIVAQMAVSVSGLAAYPFDTLQRRLQIEASKPQAEQMYSGMSDCFSKIMKNEGPKVFFKGAAANILRGTGAAIVLVVYDEIMNALARST